MRTPWGCSSVTKDRAPRTCTGKHPPPGRRKGCWERLLRLRYLVYPTRDGCGCCCCCRVCLGIRRSGASCISWAWAGAGRASPRPRPRHRSRWKAARPAFRFATVGNWQGGRAGSRLAARLVRGAQPKGVAWSCLMSRHGGWRRTRRVLSTGCNLNRRLQVSLSRERYGWQWRPPVSTSETFC